MSAGTHGTANNGKVNPKRRLIWIFGGAAAAVVTGGLLMQYFRAPISEAADTAGTARVGGPQKSALMAKVNNESITYDAVAEECVARHGREVLDDMIHRMIILKACEAQNVVVSEQEVTQEITRVAARFKLDVASYLQMLQTERNITPMQYRTSVVWPMLALKKLAGEKVEITDEDIQKAFVRNYGPRVKARVIMFDNLRQANTIWERVKRAPETFEQMAQDHSVDPNSRSLGGQVPPIPRYTGGPENLEKEAFKLKEGEISGVIELGPGRYVVLKCEGRTVPVVTDIEEVKDTLYDELKEAKIQQAVGKTFEKIKEETRVDNYFARTSSGPERATPVSATGSGPGRVQPANATTQPRASRPAATAQETPGRTRN
ncbi:MAG: peptidylprolyl isomerase [Planctomycetes bacterium]|nr:peptidylprolyl isomerase [Planctomycetota bacterium]